MNRILIIKHGSLGDIAFSLPIIYAIRKHFSHAKIDLLTEKKYISFLKLSKYFSILIEDNRSSNFFKTIKILFNLRKNDYDLIIDLQNSSRTGYYNLFFRIFSKSIISSSRKFAHFRYIIPPQGTETTTQGLMNQIKMLDIKATNDLKYEWLQTDLNEEYNNKFILLIPGVSPKGKKKQWNPAHFAEIANFYENKNYKICVVGTKNDYSSVEPILRQCKNIINAIDSSPPDIIYSIAKKSLLTITNDTGPGHIASLSGAKILWILNDNNISKANIKNDKNQFKIFSSEINRISPKQVINFIKKNNLL